MAHRTVLSSVSRASLVALLSACASSPPASPAPPLANTSPSPAVPPPAVHPPSLPVAAGRAPQGRVDTEEDLEALARDQAWPELLEHIEDIPPARREARWHDLLVDAVDHVLERARRAHQDAEELARSCEDYAARYPVLLTAKGFREIHALVMLDAVPTCTAPASTCAWLVDAFAGDAPHAQQAGDIASRNGRVQLALRFYRIAADLDPRALCADEAALVDVADRRARAALDVDAEAISKTCSSRHGR